MGGIAMKISTELKKYAKQWMNRSLFNDEFFITVRVSPDKVREFVSFFNLKDFDYGDPNEEYQYFGVGLYRTDWDNDEWHTEWWSKSKLVAEDSYNMKVCKMEYYDLLRFCSAPIPVARD
jgi:hypothetical protein